MRVTNEIAELSSREYININTIASLVPSFIRGTEKLISLSLIDDRVRRKEPVYKSLRKAFGLGSVFNQILDANRSQTTLEYDSDTEEHIVASTSSVEHPVSRLDLVKSQSGEFKIAEIEVDKVHGFGYATMARFLSPSPLGIGIVNAMQSFSQDSSLALLLTPNERFYLPELSFFARIMQQNSQDIQIVSQGDLLVSAEGVYKSEGFGRTTQIHQILQLPMFQGSKESISELENGIRYLHSIGLVNVLSRRVPQLSDKTAMAIVSNALGDPHLEAVLSTCFTQDELRALRDYIPLTYYAGFGGSGLKKELVELVQENPHGYFVKVKDSSGARGIAKPGDTAKQVELIKNFGDQVIVQEAVQSVKTVLTYADLIGDDVGQDVFSTRYGLFVSSAGEVLDLALTASSGPVAHGGTDSILMAATYRNQT